MVHCSTCQPNSPCFSQLGNSSILRRENLKERLVAYVCNVFTVTEGPRQHSRDFARRTGRRTLLRDLTTIPLNITQAARSALINDKCGHSEASPSTLTDLFFKTHQYPCRGLLAYEG